MTTINNAAAGNVNDLDVMYGSLMLLPNDIRFELFNACSEKLMEALPSDIYSAIEYDMAYPPNLMEVLEEIKGENDINFTFAEEGRVFGDVQFQNPIEVGEFAQSDDEDDDEERVTRKRSARRSAGSRRASPQKKRVLKKNKATGGAAVLESALNDGVQEQIDTIVRTHRLNNLKNEDSINKQIDHLKKIQGANFESEMKNFLFGPQMDMKESLQVAGLAGLFAISVLVAGPSLCVEIARVAAQITAKSALQRAFSDTNASRNQKFAMGAIALSIIAGTYLTLDWNRIAYHTAASEAHLDLSRKSGLSAFIATSIFGAPLRLLGFTPQQTVIVSKLTNSIPNSVHLGPLYNYGLMLFNNAINLDAATSKSMLAKIYTEQGGLFVQMWAMQAVSSVYNMAIPAARSVSKFALEELEENVNRDNAAYFLKKVPGVNGLVRGAQAAANLVLAFGKSSSSAIDYVVDINPPLVKRAMSAVYYSAKTVFLNPNLMSFSFVKPALDFSSRLPSIAKSFFGQDHHQEQKFIKIHIPEMFPVSRRNR